MRQLSDEFLRQQLLERKERLASGLHLVRDREPLLNLLEEVDAALERMQYGVYGLCEVCHDTIERDRLAADPLIRTCIDHLTPAEQLALERDLDLARRIQTELLPAAAVSTPGWSAFYRYEPAGTVSGDYCDLITTGDDGLYFLVGDVSGKGIAASMLMSHLHAMFRSLITAGLPFERLMDQANRLFCESTLPGIFATLVLGRTSASGDIDICNAGHCPPLRVGANEIGGIEATGIPLGLFCTSSYGVTKIRLDSAEHLLVYTDGLSEARDHLGQEYGTERIVRNLESCRALEPAKKLDKCLEDVTSFRSGKRHDDLTVMLVQRT